MCVLGVIILTVIMFVMGMFIGSVAANAEDNGNWVVTDEDGVIHIRYYSRDLKDRMWKHPSITQETNCVSYPVALFFYFIIKNKKRFEK